MLRLRLVASLFLLIAVCGYYLMSWILDELRPRYLEAVEEALVDEAEVLAALAAGLAGDTLCVEPFATAWHSLETRRLDAQIYKLRKGQVDLEAYITDTTGRVLFHSEDSSLVGTDFSRWRDVLLTLRGQYGARATRADEADPRSSVLHVAAPIHKEGRFLGVLTVSKPTTSINAFIETARPKMVAAGLLGLGTMILLTASVSLWLTRPLRRLTDYARRVRDGKRATLPPLGKGEIAEFGRAFDEMREALEGKRYVERYVQSLTHELKSPLAGIRGAVEILGEGPPPEEAKHFLNNIGSESVRMQAIVDKMLNLSTLEARRELLNPEPVDLNTLLREECDSLRPQFEGAGLELGCVHRGKPIVLGEPFWLRQAVRNLLQNALEFAPTGSAVEVTAEVAEDWASVIIRDRGPGIPGYARERVFERFYSLEGPRSGKKGSGLGLPLVREIASLHGGEVSLENSPGGGAVACLRLPLFRT